ncbi:MAG TPA: M14 family metallopeptidase, partial [Saprospiraceae bacterium]|nr:M14 family metallopeptidase [Saprospiraceae bacterium]
MSKSLNFIKVCSLIVLLTPSLLFGQGGYLDYSQMGNKLKELAKAPNTKLESYGKSFGNKDLWVLKLGSDANPAVLIVGGVDGRHPAGSMAAIGIAEKILVTDSIKSLLASKSIYIIPNANPDAIDGYFAKLKFEKSGNARVTDDDRNGKLGDDTFNDLNADGLITLMRVNSQAGDYVVSDKDARHMVKADLGKEQKGTHIVLSEGLDDNKNGLFNEDPSNGVNIDRNFAFDHPYFKQNSGEYAASESETRSLMDFLFAHTNIHTVINFGPQNNLSEAAKYDQRLATQRIIKSWQEGDVKVSELVSKSYNKHNTLKNAPTLPLQPGSFTQTAYYHGGKFSFSTPVWWASETAKKDSANTEKPATPMAGAAGRAPG